MEGVVNPGRRPYPLGTMLRVHCVQLFYNLSDPGMEDLPYEVESVRRFAGSRLTGARNHRGRGQAPLPYPEKPIHRPAAATVNHTPMEASPNTAPRSRPGSRRTSGCLIAKVKTSPVARAIIFTQKE